MDNSANMLQLCRLCLVKEQVNIPIFEEQGDIRRIFQKISSCLPVKVSRDDKLPKKICDGCSYKLDICYEFWNTSANSEKQLLTWLGDLGVKNDNKISDSSKTSSSHSTNKHHQTDAPVVKKEEIDLSDAQDKDDDEDDENKAYMFQQKLEESNSSSGGPSATVTTNNEDESPPPKRQRRTAAVKAAIAMDHDSDDDDDSGEPLTKIEDETDDSDGDDNDPSFVDVPSTSADDQPGPSGVGKDNSDAPKKSTNSPSKKRFSVKEIKKILGPDPVIDEEKTKLIDLLKDEPLKCPSCTTKFEKHIDLAIHSKQHEIDGMFVCHLCGLKVNSKHRMERHVSGHRRFKCQICNKILRKAMTALKHSYNHTNDKPFQCEICGKHLANAKSLDMHLNTIHHEIVTGKPLSKYDCIICKKHYESETGMRRHYSSQHRELGVDLSVICEVCGKRISSRTRLIRHMRTHTGQKPFPCTVCSRSFATKCLLTSHLRTHTGEKPYECSFCGKRFGQSAPYRYHIKIHTGEKKYVCKICGKGFISNSNLKIHVKSCLNPNK